jgi:hypothetical protein
MKTILLAAGFGTRLRPLTDTLPKCLVPIKGKPLLEIWLERLMDAGLNNFIINTHYLAEKVAFFIDNSPFRNNCTLKNEVELLGTAGTLLTNLEFIGQDECLLIHAEDEASSWLTDRIGALNSAAKDVSGAGDSLLITSAMALASGGNIWEGAVLGSIAAAVQVGRVGNIPIKTKEILEELIY